MDKLSLLCNTQKERHSSSSFKAEYLNLSFYISSVWVQKMVITKKVFESFPTITI